MLEQTDPQFWHSLPSHIKQQLILDEVKEVVREETIEFHETFLTIAGAPQEKFSYNELKDAAEQLVLLYKHSQHTQKEFATTVTRMRQNITAMLGEEGYVLQLRLQELDRAIGEAFEKVRGGRGRIITLG